VFSNVVRFLPPLNIEDAQLERGLSLVEESLVAAGATR
jgi:4-aminobutyrate aminotransferase-like enzyme